MFIPNIKATFNDEQQAHWLSLAERWEVIGCYALTLDLRMQVWDKTCGSFYNLQDQGFAAAFLNLKGGVEHLPSLAFAQGPD